MEYVFKVEMTNGETTFLEGENAQTLFMRILNCFDGEIRRITAVPAGFKKDTRDFLLGVEPAHASVLPPH